MVQASFSAGAWHTTTYLLDLLAVQIVHVLIHDDEAPRPNFISGRRRQLGGK